jgi:hypothetical protein
MPMSSQRVAAIQSCYIPWRGYFDFIASVDVFVVYDDVQYSTGSWRNRNKVKTSSGPRWITVPVHHHLGMPIDAVKIANPVKCWKRVHRQLLADTLGAAAYFKDAKGLWEDAVSHNDTYLSLLNVRLLRSICQYLGIRTQFLNARDFALEGGKTDRLICLLKKLSARRYLSGPAAKAYLDESEFRKNRIGLEYKTYDYDPYPQLWGNSFQPEVTILDLIANVGPSASNYIRSKTQDLVVVPEQPD